MVTRAAQIRKAAKMSQTAAAALAGVSPTSWRIYEANGAALTEEPRTKCDAAVARMEQMVAQRSAA